MLLYAIYRYHRQHDLKDSRYWLVLSTGFLYLSIDESIDLHGMLTNPLRSFFHAGGFLFYTWVIPGFIVCLILAVYFFPFFMRLSNRYKILFGLSIFLFVGGAVVLEVVTAYFDPKAGGFSLLVAILGTVKQAMEWVGELVFLYSLSDYIRLNMQTASLHPGNLLPH
jgi:hypothetical protein